MARPPSTAIRHQQPLRLGPRDNQVFNWDSGYPAYPYTLPNKDPTLDNGSSISVHRAELGPPVLRAELHVRHYSTCSGHTTIQANYVGTRGYRLNAGNFANMNQLNPKYLALGDTLLDDISMHPEIQVPYPSFAAPLLRRCCPIPQYAGGGVVNHFPYVGKSDYNALQVVATRRFTKGLGFLISYSFQKTLTNTDSANLYYGGTSQDVYNRGLEKSSRVLRPHPESAHDLDLRAAVRQRPAVPQQGRRRRTRFSAAGPSRPISSTSPATRCRSARASIRAATCSTAPSAAT